MSTLSIAQRLNKSWRIIATAGCFSLFGLGALLLTFMIFPLISLLTPNHQQREIKVQSTIQRTFNFFCRTMRFLKVIDYRFDNLIALKEDKHSLIVANHPSLIDYVLIASQLPQCDCLVKASIWRNPFIKGIVKAAGYIPNRDPESLLESCNQRLQQGNVLLIFPEGTRTTATKTPKLQRGAAQIAIRSQVNIRVVHITVSPSFLTKEQKWYQVPDKKPFFLIEIKNKISIESYLKEHSSPTTAARQLNKHLASTLFPTDV
ncbi:lysophospholipid acyltransferase family protein [Photobacterium kishitanii]|uniref:lysophospholipid acyltransferase family protein n=1 Tax=Photobacterium kishitanii TaxID=318456 RepID=UPI0005D32363|nr:lysophospholipid acyltransferase family protein [Photobacterium kishitanii]KJG09388.1 acyl-phosphate glycerol 3-phosphate acyltransferase [Photobacterium kishitanii]OBU33637.1 acyl-phosphate glycerol 3-phosphate acyltransferase [Photobacterium kishitanii]PSU89490.1 1-acyl-sn-glycerol-3-phosphate acyltransferase [Photobacterium kishitanii]PSV06413.1 1-acyl-sn-glycerol-3-phosphate acyltransferase [Photobacterium kishitanii]PSV11578.1 1-acyl-sn-glycerol-3-phosphate acyltransferase [Photobacter